MYFMAATQHRVFTLYQKNLEISESDQDDWTTGPQIAPKISYPTTYRVLDDKQLIYFRTAGHISSWTYHLSDDNGKTWNRPQNRRY